MSEQKHFPYEEEAKLFADIIRFFSDRLPHAISDTADHLDEAALSTELFESLSLCSDDELAEQGINRDDLSKVAVAASGLLAVAKRRNNR